MRGFFIILFCLLLSSFPTLNADVITLREIHKDVDIKVIGVAEEYIHAAIVKKSLKSLSIQFGNDTRYPDAIFLNDTDVAVACKIKEITEDTVAVLIPTSAVSSLQISFQPEDKNKQLKTGVVLNRPTPAKIEDKSKTLLAPVVEVERKNQTLEQQRIDSELPEDGKEDRIIDEIRASREKVNGIGNYRLKSKKKKTENVSKEDKSGIEIEKKPIGSESMGAEPLEEDEEAPEPNKSQERDTRDNGITKVTEKGLEQEKVFTQDKNLGGVEGKILYSGKPLPDCQVKLQMLEKGGLLSKGYRPVEGAVEYETITDKDGVYRFTSVPPGSYKLYWKPSTEETWVRRFKMEPDVIVDAGRLTNPKVIETVKRTLN